MIRPCVSGKIRLQDVVVATVAREMGVWAQARPGATKSICRDDSGVMLKKGFFKIDTQDQVWAREGCGSGDRRDGRRCRPGPHKGNYQAPEVENPYSRYDILESLVANSLWVGVWLSDTKVPSA